MTLLTMRKGKIYRFKLPYFEHDTLGLQFVILSNRINW